MFFSKTAKSLIKFEDIGLDFHAHWLPGVDDGCQTIEESIHILTVMKNLGYTRLIATPHIMGERYTNTKQELIEKFDAFVTRSEVQNLGLQLGVAAEYLLDEKFEDKIKKNDFLTIDNHHILVETSMNYEFPFVKEYLYELVQLGYKPILAHPERYRYFSTGNSFLDACEEFHFLGVELQLNLFSLAGLYGSVVQKLAESLIECDGYSYVCSDIHFPGQIKYFEAVKKSIFLEKLIQSETLKNKQFL